MCNIYVTSIRRRRYEWPCGNHDSGSNRDQRTYDRTWTIRQHTAFWNSRVSRRRWRRHDTRRRRCAGPLHHPRVHGSCCRRVGRPPPPRPHTVTHTYPPSIGRRRRRRWRRTRVTIIIIIKMYYDALRILC